MTSSTDAYKGSYQSQNSITDKDVMKIQGKTASPNELLNRIQEIDVKYQNEATDLRGLKARNWWGITTLIGLMIALNLKFWWNSKEYENGYETALKDIKDNVEMKKEFTEIYDSIKEVSLQEVEELLKRKRELEQELKEEKE